MDDPLCRQQDKTTLPVEHDPANSKVSSRVIQSEVRSDVLDRHSEVDCAVVLSKGVGVTMAIEEGVIERWRFLMFA